jgi:cytochrome P450
LAPKFAPWERDWLQDPWPSYAALRADEPVYWSEELNHWILSRYHDIVQVLRDPRFTATNRPPQRRWNRPTMMVTADPPEHSRLRRPVAHQFGSAAVDSLAPMMKEIVDGLLDAAEANGGFDVAWDYARVLPRRIITHIMGVPYVAPERPTGQLNAFGMEDRGEPRASANDGHGADGAPTRPIPAAAGMARAGPVRQRRQPPSGNEDVETPQDRWFKEAIRNHREELQDDVLQTLIKAETGGNMSDEEVLDTATILYGAGQETTGSLITNAMYQLLTHPDQLKRLQDRPEMLRPAVEELLRYDAPVHSVRRKAVEDVEMSGKKIRAGDKVLVMLMAANHDPEIFADPERLDLGRKENYHIAFGSGVHTCLGGILARAEAQVAIGSLVRRFPKIRLAVEHARYQGSFVLRTIRELPVEVE